MRDDCRKILTDLERFLDGECPQGIERRVDEHLHDCPSCQSRADFERHLRALVASRYKDSAPRALVDRVVAALRAGQNETRID